MAFSTKRYLVMVDDIFGTRQWYSGGFPAEYHTKRNARRHVKHLRETYLGRPFWVYDVKRDRYFYEN